jgi:hypothetical protein
MLSLSTCKPVVSMSMATRTGVALGMQMNPSQATRGRRGASRRQAAPGARPPYEGVERSL